MHSVTEDVAIAVISFENLEQLDRQNELTRAVASLHAVADRALQEDNELSLKSVG